MAIEYLVPSANATNSGVAILLSNDYTLINEGSPNGLTADADGSFNHTNNDDMSGADAIWALTNLAGFGTVNSATFRVRARLVNPGSGDTMTYRFRLNIGGTTKDVTFETANDENNGFTNYEIDVGTFTEAEYNAATVTLIQSVYNKDMGPDGADMDIDALELEVDYSAADVPRTVTGISEAVTVTNALSNVGRGRAVLCTIATVAVVVALATVNLGRDVTGITETVAVTTPDAVVSRGREVSGSTEIITVTNPSADVGLGRGVTGVTEIVEITSNLATVTIGGDRNVTGITAQLNITANDASVFRGDKLRRVMVVG
jgi:hypothetical protein